MSLEKEQSTIFLIKEYLRYEPLTGKLFWIKRVGRGGSTSIGKEAGTFNIKTCYITVTLFGKHYQAHVIAWIFIKGKFPMFEIDHKDRVRYHNWETNLREATSSQNKLNSNMNRRNTSGFKGVSWSRQNQTWMAFLAKKYLGQFVTKEEAFAAYTKAAQEKFGEEVGIDRDAESRRLDSVICGI